LASVGGSGHNERIQPPMCIEVVVRRPNELFGSSCIGAGDMAECVDVWLGCDADARGQRRITCQLEATELLA
jgi:hypothetical protein